MESNKRSKGRGRGVLALASYEPCPRPSASTIGSWHRSEQAGTGEKQIHKNASKMMNCTTTSANNCVNDRTNGNIENVIKKDVTNNGCREKKVNSNYKNQDIRNNTINNPGINGHHSPREKGGSEKTDICRSTGDLLAKYSYEAKPGKPGGFAELTIKQGEKLTLICKEHLETRNNHWWEVKNERGEQGFVPAKFCMILEETPTTLPWLQNKRLLEEKEEKERQAKVVAKGDTGFGAPAHGTPTIKAYQSAYTNNNNAPQMKNKAELNKEYYCEVCDKNLNGPQPYKSHMSSKAHREEVEYHQSKEQYN